MAKDCQVRLTTFSAGGDSRREVIVVIVHHGMLTGCQHWVRTRPFATYVIVRVCNLAACLSNAYDMPSHTSRRQAEAAHHSIGGHRRRQKMSAFQEPAASRGV
ncbi:hypothetical protein BD310DRAFT_632148 [Dichomitus squalens]|uniref:Uncharacterized protein n=1 Tax=Dichomitus squalens TaxID=114155 RepID=A0A4Q9PPL0_9APHY|nr:hypothetical protein BD310DRAFT_632148 [Dichomitus squalens]